MSDLTKHYGVQNKYDPNDTEWYDSKEEQERALDEANSYILVEAEVVVEEREI